MTLKLSTNQTSPPVPDGFAAVRLVVATKATYTGIPGLIDEISTIFSSQVVAATFKLLSFHEAKGTVKLEISGWLAVDTLNS